MVIDRIIEYRMERKYFISIKIHFNPIKVHIFVNENLENSSNLRVIL